MPKRKQTHNQSQLTKRTLNQTARSQTQYKTNRRLLLKEKPLCHWCNNREATTADHLVEVDRWPKDQLNVNGLDNLVPACKPCNSSRGARYGNLKRKSIYEPAPTVNINAKKTYATERITIQTQTNTRSFFSSGSPAPVFQKRIHIRQAIFQARYHHLFFNMNNTDRGIAFEFQHTGTDR